MWENQAIYSELPSSIVTVFDNTSVYLVCPRKVWAHITCRERCLERLLDHGWRMFRFHRCGFQFWLQKVPTRFITRHNPEEKLIPRPTPRWYHLRCPRLTVMHCYVRFGVSCRGTHRAETFKYWILSWVIFWARTFQIRHLRHRLSSTNGTFSSDHTHPSEPEVLHAFSKLTAP